MSRAEPTEPEPVSAASGEAARTAAREAALALEQTCGDAPEEPDERLQLYMASVAELARSLGRELDYLKGDGDALVGAALRSADLANLAACALPELPRESQAFRRTAAAAHLAAGAARALSLEHLPPEEPGNHAAADLRGCAWRASLAARQVDEILLSESP